MGVEPNLDRLVGKLEAVLDRILIEQEHQRIRINEIESKISFINERILAWKNRGVGIIIFISILSALGIKVISPALFDVAKVLGKAF